MPKRFIIVPERFAPDLEEATQAAMLQAGSLSVPELYQLVKKHLARSAAPHEDKQLEPQDIPERTAHWSYE